MGKVMVTIRSELSPPSLAEVRSRYDLEPGQVDESFGVVPIDPDDHLYCILVEEPAAEKILATARSAKDDSVQGPFGNARIAPFGPPSG